jgi:uncharacterized protein (DUF58 family)
VLLSEVIQYKNLPLIAKKAMEGFITGLHNSPFHGFSVEFSEHRAYNVGESVRNLDWKLLAKTEKKYIKQFNEETNLKCHLWIDISNSMEYPSQNYDKLKFAILAGSSIAQICTNQRDAFSFTLFSDQKIKWRSEIKSTQLHFRNCLAMLEPLWNNQKIQSEIQLELSEIASTIKRRNMVVICSDLIWSERQKNEEHKFWETLSMLRYQKCEVLLFHVSHNETEVQLEVGDAPIKFVDLESKEILKLQPQEIRDVYQKHQNTVQKDIENRCLQLGINYFLSDISEPIQDVLMRFYVQRSKIL